MSYFLWLKHWQCLTAYWCMFSALIHFHNIMLTLCLEINVLKCCCTAKFAGVKGSCSKNGLHVGVSSCVTKQCMRSKPLCIQNDLKYRFVYNFCQIFPGWHSQTSCGRAFNWIGTHVLQLPQLSCCCESAENQTRILNRAPPRLSESEVLNIRKYPLIRVSGTS